MESRGQLYRITGHNLILQHIGTSTKDLESRISISPLNTQQCNGQAEAINKALLDALKKHLHEAKDKWVEEL